MITRGHIIAAILLGAVVGFVFFKQALHLFAVRNAPVVTGRILKREPIKQYSVPRVDFTIQIEGTDTQVHAHTQRYLIHRIPDTARFHYNGDPTREVFLFEHEESPYWIFLFCWGISLGLAISLKSSLIRRSLGWEQ